LNINQSKYEEPKVEEAPSPRPSSQCQSQVQPTVAMESLKPREGSPMAKNSLLSQDINVKVASELLIKLSENSKDAQYQKVKVKAEPMEVDPPPAELTPPASHLLTFSTLGASEKNEPMSNLPETLACPQKDLFSQDISVKMASELLFKLSGTLPLRTQTLSFLDECFRQSPFNSRSKSSSPAEKDDGEPGNGLAQWKLHEQLFPCPVCGKVFGRQQTLSRHLSLHTEERKYKCHLCPYAAKCRANLNQHLTIHSVKLVQTDAEQIVSAVTADSTERKNCPYYYSCHVCGFQTELNAQFVSHMSLHVDKEQWMFSLCCSVCDYVCMEESDMKSHISTGHAGNDSCRETKSTSSSLSALSDSLNSSEGGDVAHGNEELKNLLAPPSSAGSQASCGSFECVFCNFVCKTRSMYERHLQIHLITRMFECDVCHKFLKTPEQLLEHKKCHTVPSGGLKCPFCIYSTNRPAAMECHLKTHCKVEYRCRICQGLWPDQASLEAHMRGHRLGNHYKCERCGYLSKTANKLIEHVRVHTGERPFHCDRCSYSCKRKDNLNLHKKLKHAPRQTFGCRECPFTTTHPFVFSRHLKKHQSGGPGGLDGGVGGGGEDEEEEKSGGSGGSSPLMSLTASQALQSVALSLTLGRSRQLETASHSISSPSLFPPSSRHMLEQYRNGEQAHLIPLTTLYTFHSHLHSRWRPATSPHVFASPSHSHKHSFLAYLGLMERAKTV
uniref:Zinc finger protein 827 n=1 Tax=Xiphophorus maculatus TaxID=8083 RepID=A0A3B5R5V7_XIPMA